MTNISNPLRLRADRPIEVGRYATLDAIDKVLTRIECPYMLVGATARDLLLSNVFGQKITRATQDIDIAISIDSWERFQIVRSEILRAPDFQASTSQPYRVLHKARTSGYATPVDILPFGRIATDVEAFQWPPPDLGLVMNVAAFGDAYDSSVMVNMGPEFALRIASIPGLVLLKLLAWMDRTDRKDASDLLRLIETYGDSGNEDRLYSDEVDLLATAKFDVSLAGASLLALDALAVAAPLTIATIRSLLADSKRLATLESHMVNSQYRLDDGIIDRSSTLLSAFVSAFCSS